MTDTPRTPHYERRLLFFAIILIALVSIGGWQLYRVLNASTSGISASDFDLPYLGEEGTFRLSEQRGKVVVVNMWASWCEPCQEEAPLLRAIYEDYHNEGVVFVGVAVNDEVHDALAYINEFDIPYINVIDNDDEIARQYHIYGVPITFVVDREGYIIKTFFSSPTEVSLRQEIDQALRRE